MGHVICISSFLIWCRPAAHEARDIPLRMPDRHARSRLGLPATIPPFPLDAVGGVSHGACRRVDAGALATACEGIGVIGQLPPELGFYAWIPIPGGRLRLCSLGGCEVEVNEGEEHSESNVAAAGTPRSTPAHLARPDHLVEQGPNLPQPRQAGFARRAARGGGLGEGCRMSTRTNCSV